MSSPHSDVQDQFNLRAEVFNISANWVTDSHLLNTHVDMAGSLHGNGLELCCGTGVLGKALTQNGWQMIGVDITPGMLEIASRYFDVRQHNVEEPLPFSDKSFDLVIMRQALFFFEPNLLLSEIKRVLSPKGKFILSQTVPFADPEDELYLKKVHLLKQAQMKKFYTADDLASELRISGFKITDQRFITVRESITKWMDFAPEMEPERKDKVIHLIKNIPQTLQKYRNVEQCNDELLENWNWVLFKAEI